MSMCKLRSDTLSYTATFHSRRCQDLLLETARLADAQGSATSGLGGTPSTPLSIADRVACKNDAEKGALLKHEMVLR